MLKTDSSRISNNGKLSASARSTDSHSQTLPAVTPIKVAVAVSSCDQAAR